MKPTIMKTLPVLLALTLAGSLPAWAQNADLDQLKTQLQSMQKMMEEMQKKIDQLEKEKAQPPTPPTTPPPRACARTHGA